ncbi:MAG: molybdopterin molybdotransferase MoeA [Peptococcaceae bacterium]|nr:molybdopterin molybdotransferase MoeA [Peptococcaceae bacterium]
MDFFRVYTVDEALAVLRKHIAWDFGVTYVTLREALGRDVGEEITAPEDVPGFDRSTMDGFAVRAQDTFGASEGLPAYLTVTGEVLMGQKPGGSVGVAEAYHIPTGGMLPDGADAVVMVEYTEQLDEHNIGVIRPVAPGENIIRRGDDLKAGSLLFPAGHRLRPQDLGLLAAAGISKVPVRKRVRVGIITTGNEVIPVDQTPGPGQVRDVNSYTSYAQVLENGGVPEEYGIIPDDFHAVADVVQGALEECDMVVISGGSSVGTRDVTARVVDSLGDPGVLFHGLAVRPGKPTIGAVIGGKPVIGLPGHPVSAMVVFNLIVRPLLNPHYRSIPVQARILRSLRSQPGKEDYVRVSLAYKDGELTAEPILGKSGLIATMAGADGLVRIPLDKEGVEAGDIVEVLLF